MTENNNRAVITGLGMICAICNSVDEAWNNAINSVSGIHKTTTLDTTDCYADLAAEVKCNDLPDGTADRGSSGHHYADLEQRHVCQPPQLTLIGF